MSIPEQVCGPASPPSYGHSRRAFQRFAAAAALWLLCVAAPAPPAEARTMQIVVLGDSLSAGYLLPADAAFPAVLERALKAKGIDVAITNAGVSGDTASAGLERVDWSVPDGTDGVILELGANDALRGIDPAVTYKALTDIVTRLKERGIPVLLAGMMAPRNLGPDYGAAFDAIFPRIAKEQGITLYPFFLDGIVADPRLNLKDGMHPTPEGVTVIVERILPTVQDWLSGLGRGG
jgi:acyl-CoA thioesterase-1